MSPNESSETVDSLIIMFVLDCDILNSITLSLINQLFQDKFIVCLSVG